MVNENKKALWAGRVITMLAALPFLFSFAMKLSGSPQVQEGMAHLGWPAAAIGTLAFLEALSMLLYLLPASSVLGAVVLTGYLGGAIATHLRIGEPVYLHVVIGVLIWLGLFLRDPRLHVLLPVRTKDFLVSSEITIARPVAEVFAFLRPLKNFQSWNPFLKPGANVKLDFRGVDGQPGFVASWDGDREVGAGEQELTRILEGQRIDFDLRFFRPFRGNNKGSWIVEAADANQTRVRWCMTGPSPFPMSVIGLFIRCEKMIVPQFAAGLAKLKEKLEATR